MADKDFAIGNMTDDLVDTTLELCGKDENKTLRFPKVLYSSYVKRIVETALDIQELVWEANEIAIGEMRATAQKTASAKCVYLNHLIRIAYRRGWISDKQRNRWQALATKIKFAIVSWIKSDKKRTETSGHTGTA